jgi:predicted permease
VAVSFLLLVAAGLFVRSVRGAGHLDLGFRQDHEFLATVDVSLSRYDSAQGRQFFRNLVQQAGEFPGVRAAALARTVPLGSDHIDFDIYADLPTLEKDKGHTVVEAEIVTPAYFEAMGIRLVRGRVFSIRDDSTAPRVMVINSAMAARLWPGRDPIGQQVRLAPDGPPAAVVGVVGTVTSFVLGERPRLMAYMPFAQYYESEMTLLLHTERDPQAFAAPVRALISSLDANVAPYAMTTMATHLHDGIAFLPMRFGAILATAIGLLGLVLAVVGLYGVVAYSVAQRRREIGIRMAMGATARDILWSVVREGMIMTGVGLALGGVIALTTTQILTNLLIGVSARDPLTFLAFASALTVATLTACLVPAWRAARIAPAGAMRG